MDIEIDLVKAAQYRESETTIPIDALVT
jgi:hypothetical protein